MRFVGSTKIMCDAMTISPVWRSPLIRSCTAPGIANVVGESGIAHSDSNFIYLQQICAMKNWKVAESQK